MNTAYKTNDKKNHAPWARVGVLALNIVCLSTLSAGGRAITGTRITVSTLSFPVSSSIRCTEARSKQRGRAINTLRPGSQLRVSTT